MRCATVAVRKPEQQVRKVSHRGSKQLWTIEITRSLLSSPLVSTINCSLASQALLEVIHQGQSRSLYYCLFVPHKYGCYSSHTSRSWRIAHSTQSQPRGCNTILGPVMLINRKFDISYKLDISRNLSTFPSQLIAVKSKLNFCHSVPSPRGVFGGFNPSETKLPPPIEIWSTIKQWCLFKFQNVKCTAQM